MVFPVFGKKCRTRSAQYFWVNRKSVSSSGFPAFPPFKKREWGRINFRSASVFPARCSEKLVPEWFERGSVQRQVTPGSIQARLVSPSVIEWKPCIRGSWTRILLQICPDSRSILPKTPKSMEQM